MNLSHVRSMILVAERGSISAASKDLFISSVALLQQINQLESSVGFKIFNRSYRGVTLTPAGQALYRGAKRSLAEMDALLKTCRDMQAQESHTIRISLYRPYYLIHLCEAYCAEHPDIAFQYGHAHMSGTTWIVDQLNDHSFDAILGGSDQMQMQMCDKIAFLPVELDRLCCFCAQTHPLAKKRSVSLETLKDYDLYSIPPDETVVTNQLDEQLRKSGCTMKRVPFSDTAMLQCCMEGSVYILEEKMSMVFDQLCCVPIEPAQTFYHGIAYRKDAPAQTLAFVEFVRRKLAQANPSPELTPPETARSRPNSKPM